MEPTNTQTEAIDNAASGSVSAGLLDNPAVQPKEGSNTEEQEAQPLQKGEQQQTKETGLQLPGKDATPEQWAEFYNKLGRPEKAEEYELPIPKGDNGEFAKEIAPILHKAGLTQDQAKTLAGEWNSMISALQEKETQAQQQKAAQTESRNKAEAQSLKKEWGNDYDSNIETARRAKAQFLPADKADAIIDALENAIGTKATVQFLHDIGKGLLEDSVVGLGAGKSPQKSAATILFGDN